MQNFGGRKFWWNISHQKLADNILLNAQNFQNAKNNNYVLSFYRSIGIMEYSCGTWLKWNILLYTNKYLAS